MKVSLYSLLFFALLAATACIDEDAPTAEGTLLDFEVPDTVVSEDYVVGAHYLSFNWNPNLYETPVIGQYDAASGDPTAYEQHIEYAAQGGIDFFIFPMRSAVVAEEYAGDSAFVANLMQAPSASSMNFTLSYSFAAMELSSDSRVDAEADLLGVMTADFRRMAHFLGMTNAATTSQGAVVLYIRNAHLLYAQDYAAVYEQLRSTVREEAGVELYIIGEQQEWTPPLRFEHRLIDGVDAVSHRSYVAIGPEGNQAFYDRFVMFEQFADLALSISGEELERVGLNYVPQISPSYDGTIVDPNNTDYVIEKDEAWFRTFSDIAKRASDNNPERLIILDAFNSWNNNRQVEPGESYNTEFLEILRSEFKVD